MANIDILIEHMDDAYKSMLFKMIDRIKDLKNTHAQVRVFKSYSGRSTYLFPDYIVRITCSKGTVQDLVKIVCNYYNEKFNQTGLKMKIEKNGNEIYPLHEGKSNLN